MLYSLFNYYIYTKRIFKDIYYTLLTLRYSVIYIKENNKIMRVLYKDKPIINSKICILYKAYLEVSGKDQTEYLKLRGAENNFYGQELTYLDLFPRNHEDFLTIIYYKPGIQNPITETFFENETIHLVNI